MKHETSPEHIEQTGPNTMVVEHDDGSKFECDFKGKFPEGAKGKPPGSGVIFSGFGNGTGGIRAWREKLGLS